MIIQRQAVTGINAQLFLIRLQLMTLFISIVLFFQRSCIGRNVVLQATSETQPSWVNEWIACAYI